MTKRIFGIALIVILTAILIVNTVQDASAKKEMAAQKKQVEALAGNVDDPPLKGLTIGNTPPDFELMTLDEEKIKLSDFKGKKVILNFWATWCPPCRAEMPHMENFYKKKAKDLNVEIIAVNLTSAEKGLNKIEKVEKFIDEYQLTFPIPLDTYGEVGNTYRIIPIPTSYIIDSNGVIQQKIVGPMDEKMMEKIMKGLIKCFGDLFLKCFYKRC